MKKKKGQMQMNLTQMLLLLLLELLHPLLLLRPSPLQMPLQSTSRHARKQPNAHAPIKRAPVFFTGRLKPRYTRVARMRA